MTKNSAAVAASSDAFEIDSLDDFSAADTADMTVTVNGKLTNWVWTFAGPGHPKTVEQTNKAARERLHEARQQEQARVNGKKVKLPEESVEDVRARNVNFVVDRLIGWSPVRIGGQDYPFTPDNARKLIGDPGRISLLTQALEFISDDQAFTRRSAAD